MELFSCAGTIVIYGNIKSCTLRDRLLRACKRSLYEK